MCVCLCVQEQFIELCKTLYNMFSEEALEQQLYHAIATVASLLLRIGEVGKKFNNGTKKRETTPQTSLSAQTLPHSPQGEEEGPGHGASGESEVCRALADAQLEVVVPQMSDEETKDDASVSSYSVVSAGSLQCEDIAEDTVLIRGGEQRQGSVLDTDWSITFEQVLASMLTEPPLVDYFERKRDIQAKMAACKAQRAVERQISSASDHELTRHSTWAPPSPVHVHHTGNRCNQLSGSWDWSLSDDVTVTLIGWRVLQTKLPVSVFQILSIRDNLINQ